MNRTIPLAALALLGVGFVGAQFVPYRVNNPPVRQGPVWDSPDTEALARTACFDCHSNEVRVPWYGYIAPFSWLVRDHVDEARGELNLSEMDLPQEEAGDAGEEVLEGEMPPRYYTLLHPAARLTPEQRSTLAAGLNATLGTEDEDDEEEEGEEEED